MPQHDELYEVRMLSDPELPVQILHALDLMPKRRCTLHWHEHLEMHYVYHGGGTVMLNQVPHTLRPGDLLIVNPNELHYDTADDVPYQSDIVIFDLKALSPELAQRNILFCPIIHDDKTIAELFGRLHEESQFTKPAGRQMCKALLLVLLSYLVRNYTAKTLNERDSLQRQKDLERLYAALRYIDECYSQPITNAQLAEVARMSVSRFIHMFRQCVGMPPMRYVSDVRLKKAMSLLTTSNMAVTDVSAAVGFRDYNNFGRLFLKRFGITPAKARRKP